jgi:adenine-specific DNA-methyltransferase
MLVEGLELWCWQNPIPRLSHEFPDRISRYPQIRFMGSKFRLLPWLHDVFSELDFRTALDAFSGSGCVAYLLKSMGKEVHANDFLNFCSVLAHATIENPGVRLNMQEALRHDLRQLRRDHGL